MGRNLSIQHDWQGVLSSRDGAYHDERFFAGNDRFGQRSIGRIVREVFSTGKKSQKSTPLQSHVIADRAPQHGITGLKSIKYRALSDRCRHIQSEFTANVGEISKVCRQNDANHSSTIFARRGQFVTADSAPSGIPNILAGQSTRRCRFCAPERKFVEYSPKFPDRLDRLCELAEVHRFDHISVGAKLIASLYVWPLA